MTSPNGGVGKTASNVIDALKVQPMTLALIVITAVFMYFVYSGVSQNRKDIHEVMKTMVEKCIGK